MTLTEPIKTVIDASTFLVSVIALVTQVLPVITTILAFAWWCYRLYNEHQRGKIIRKELLHGDERLDRLDP